jgi:hypothetical protein
MRLQTDNNKALRLAFGCLCLIVVLLFCPVTEQAQSIHTAVETRPHLNIPFGAIAYYDFGAKSDSLIPNEIQ